MNFSLPKFFMEFYGAAFEGDIKVWSKATKRTLSYPSGKIEQLIEDVGDKQHTEDLYISLCTQPNDLPPSARGSNETAVSLPGVFADIDFALAKESAKKYPPDAETALSLIQSFDAEPFLIQNSGNGFHVLYAFEKPLVMSNRAERRKAQTILRQFGQQLMDHFKQAGYEIDNVFDLARVFRVPASFNHKSGSPKLVEVVAFNPHNRLGLDDLKYAVPAEGGNSSKGTAPNLADHSLIKRDCPWYSHYVGDGAAKADEPNWYAAASITVRCKHGEQIFHTYSSTHHGYNEREADKKLERAGETLIKACRRAGPFNPANVRGRGIWLEDGNVVVNLGDPIESEKFLYLCFESIPVSRGKAFNVERLRDHLRLYNWRNPQDADLLFGWLAMAPICGALAWRTHAFIYGPARSGKTTIHAIASLVLTPLAIAADGQSTEAGIRQTLGPDSLPILIDEFESDQKDTTLRNILRLARSASSADVPVLRGTPEGRAMSFSLRTAFLFGAINPRGMSPADQSRIAMFELLMHDNNRETGKRIASDEAHFRSTGSAWASHMIALAHLVQPAADAIDVHLTGDRRHRQNMSILIGAGFVALHSRIPTDEEACELADKYSATMEGHALEAYRDDAQECLDHLLSHVVDGFPLGDWLFRLYEDMQKRGNLGADAERIATTYGIRIISAGETAGLYIANGAPALEGVFRDTPWGKRAWEKALRKLAGAFTPRDPVQFRLLGKKRALGLPLDYLPDEAINYQIGPRE